MKSSVLRKLQVYNLKLLKDLLSFRNTYFKEQFSVTASKIRYVKRNTEGNLKESKL